MGKYSIKELEKLSGIKAHTLRIWEKRYNIISPDRTNTNIRTYSDEELKKLLSIAILNHHGIKISKIAELSDEEIKSKVTQLSEEEDEEGDLNLFIDQLSIAMVELDEAKFEKLLSNFILRFGFERTMLEIMYPFLQKIGILWLSGNINPVQEHFISNLIRQKIIVAIDGLSVTQNENAKKAVCFLPENELHEIGLLFYYYLIKSLKYKSYYLGQFVPLKDLQQVERSLKPDYLITTISHVPSNTSIGDIITQLSTNFLDCTILISGKPVIDFTGTLPKNVQIFNNAKELKQILS